MKLSKVLVITPFKYLNYVVYQGDILKHFPLNYNQKYIHALEESFGVKLIRVKPEEFYEAVRNVDEREAEKIADRWISKAEKIIDTTKSEVIKSAKMYLAFEALRKKYGAVGISTHMRSLTGSDKIEDMVWPSLGIIEFQKRGIMAICQEYENIMVTHLLGYYMSGRPSMLGDVMIDTINNIEIVLHCGAPINLHENNRISYVIWSHAESPVRGTLKHGSGAGAQVKLPVGETVTV